MTEVGHWYDPDSNEWFVVYKMNESQYKVFEKEKLDFEEEEKDGE